MFVLEYPRLKLANLLLGDCLRSHLVSLYDHILSWSFSDICFISMHTLRAQTHTSPMLLAYSCWYTSHPHTSTLHTHISHAYTHTRFQPCTHRHLTNPHLIHTRAHTSPCLLPHTGLTLTLQTLTPPALCMHPASLPPSLPTQPLRWVLRKLAPHPQPPPVAVSDLPFKTPTEKKNGSETEGPCLLQIFSTSGASAVGQRNLIRFF